MAGFTQARQQAILDSEFPTSASTDHIAYSSNGTSENTAIITSRTAVGATGWAAATAANPSVKANNTALLSAAAATGGTLTHWAVFSASTAGTQKIDWTPLTSSRTLVAGDKVDWAIGAAAITLD